MLHRSPPHIVSNLQPIQEKFTDLISVAPLHVNMSTPTHSYTPLVLAFAKQEGRVRVPTLQSSGQDNEPKHALKDFDKSHVPEFVTRFEDPLLSAPTTDHPLSRSPAPTMGNQSNSSSHLHSHTSVQCDTPIRFVAFYSTSFDSFPATRRVHRKSPPELNHSTYCLGTSVAYQTLSLLYD